MFQNTKQKILVNWDDDIPYMEKMKNMFQTTNITIFITINPLLIHHYITINHYKSL